MGLPCVFIGAQISVATAKRDPQKTRFIFVKTPQKYGEKDV
jgi:hypothetical protein